MLPLPNGQMVAMSNEVWWKPTMGPSRLWWHSPPTTDESGARTHCTTLAPAPRGKKEGRRLLVSWVMHIGVCSQGFRPLAPMVALSNRITASTSLAESTTEHSWRMAVVTELVDRMVHDDISRQLSSSLEDTVQESPILQFLMTGQSNSMEPLPLVPKTGVWQGSSGGGGDEAWQSNSITSLQRSV